MELKMLFKKIKTNYTDIFIIMFSSTLFLFIYWSDVNRPGSVFKLGWYQIWYDQSQYYDMIIGMTKGNLGNFQYPIGYPFLGFIGQLLYPKDPFLIVNIVLFVFFIWLSYRVTVKFLNITLSVLANIFLALFSINMFSVPWTSTVTAASLVYIIYIFIYKKYDIYSNIIAGLCLGMSFAARIGDFFPMALGFAFYAVYYIVQHRRINYANVWGAFLSLFIIIATLSINYKFSHSLLGPYMSSVTSQGFNIASIPFKFYGYAINSFTFHGETHTLAVPLLKYSFLFVFFPIGLYHLIIEKNTRDYGLFLLVLVLGWSLIYMPFVAFTGTTLKYGGLHYIKMLFPVFNILSIKFIVDFIDNIEIENGLVYRKTLLIYFMIGMMLLLIFLQFRTVQINLSDVKVQASENSDKAYLAIDNDISTRWDTNRPQEKGMYYQIDLQKGYLINKIQMDTVLSPGGYPRRFDLFYSNNGDEWTKVFTPGMTTSTVTDFYFDPVRARFLKIVLTDSQPTNGDWWSIHELRIWGK